jgi:hypothetical protein
MNGLVSSDERCGLEHLKHRRNRDCFARQHPDQPLQPLQNRMSSTTTQRPRFRTLHCNKTYVRVAFSSILNLTFRKGIMEYLRPAALCQSLINRGRASEQEAEALTARNLSQNAPHVSEYQVTASLLPGQNAMTPRAEAAIHALRCSIGLFSGAHFSSVSASASSCCCISFLSFPSLTFTVFYLRNTWLAQLNF